eukprot:CAMPEP_0115569600 /NCGR_PEP_ID=MMETSP0271-20121206/105273_1 /TAXON_ID=71861 /ORGANISM="Scrippsiella trochoidea, Strain CCMP3099" /LENGTH=149 /DNA_ID=CAMNT_0003004123 /DNA_START=59 /DNA_END=504 /DNA_ORIENTATION=+
MSLAADLATDLAAPFPTCVARRSAYCFSEICPRLNSLPLSRPQKKPLFTALLKGPVSCQGAPAEVILSWLTSLAESIHNFLAGQQPVWLEALCTASSEMCPRLNSLPLSRAQKKPLFIALLAGPFNCQGAPPEDTPAENMLSQRVALAK